MPGREKLYVCADVDLSQHPRVLACEDPGGCLGLWLAMTSYSREHLTDGQVPKRFAIGLWGDRRNASRLKNMVGAGLLREHSDTYEVLRYAPRNQTKDMVEESRRKARERMATVRANKTRTSSEHAGHVPSSSSSSSSGSKPETEPEVVAGPVRRSSSDGAFGMTVDAWKDGVRSVTGAEMVRPVARALSVLLEALGLNTAEGEDAVAKARELGAEYAKKNPRRTLSPFGFADWCGSGRPDNGAPRSSQDGPSTSPAHRPAVLLKSPRGVAHG